MRCLAIVGVVTVSVCWFGCGCEGGRDGRLVVIIIETVVGVWPLCGEVCWHGLRRR